jgi:nitrite reductase/ring-hydroxylating ferredoxin subunit
MVIDDETPRPPDEDQPPVHAPGDVDSRRRRFLGNVSRAAMTVGLVGGYGGLGLIAGRYLYPARPGDRIWQFVTEVDAMEVGESRRYRAPSGESISVVRQGRMGDETDFIALSSTCPHLGCQVHWEEQNNRYFCPCHNGTFDPSGNATGGPPAEAGQRLGRYPLRVEGGLLFIEVPATRLVDEGRRGQLVSNDRGGICKPGHDRCLDARGRFAKDEKA